MIIKSGNETEERKNIEELGKLKANDAYNKQMIENLENQNK